MLAAVRRHSDSVYTSQNYAEQKFFVPLTKIGSGTTAKIYTGLSPREGRIIMKNMKKECDLESHIVKELVILKRLQSHKNIVKFLNLIIKNDEIFSTIIVLEKCDMDLFTYIHENKFSKRLKNLDKLIKDLSLGLNYIHSKNILHLDIKPDNILVNFRMTNNLNKYDDNILFKITDFSHSVISNDTIHLDKYYTFSSGYTPPEYYLRELSFRKDVYYSKHSDIWALGLVIMEYIIGDLVYKVPVNECVYELLGCDPKTINTKLLKFSTIKIATLLINRIGFMKFIKIEEKHIISIKNMLYFVAEERFLPYRNCNDDEIKRTILINNFYLNTTQTKIRKQIFRKVLICIEKLRIDPSIFIVFIYNFDRMLMEDEIILDNYKISALSLFILCCKLFYLSENNIISVIKNIFTEYNIGDEYNLYIEYCIISELYINDHIINKITEFNAGRKDAGRAEIISEFYSNILNYSR